MVVAIKVYYSIPGYRRSDSLSFLLFKGQMFKQSFLVNGYTFNCRGLL